MKLEKIFNIHQGHQITDEEIYNSKGGEIPIFTGNNEIKGYWDKTIIDKSCLPCLTYATKAFAGTISIQRKLFDANNTACLWLKDECKEAYCLQWFKYVLPKYFMENATSKGGVSYLNRDIVLNLDIEVPNKSEQLKQIEIYDNIEALKKAITEYKEEYNKLINKSVIIPNLYKSQLPINSVLNYVSRNDSLSEEGLYNLNTEDKSAIVLSGDSDVEIYGKIDCNQKNIHYLINKQGFRVVSRGNAGQINYLPQGNYATNTNAFLFYMLDSFKNLYKIDTPEKEMNYLKFLCLYLQPIFYSASSNSDVSVFPLTQIMTSLCIPNFEYNENIEKYAKLYDNIQCIGKKLNDAKKAIEDLSSKYLI